nr:UDP-2,4-diacetamido-2,4,6-trideoxy-beta-L-altropyranose hydrolase [Acinetobacter sp. Marseille-Q1620]
MIFGIRADASVEIGSGHIMRCLSIADALIQQGHECFFICRNHVGNLIDFIKKYGYKVFSLENGDNQVSSEHLTEYQRWLTVTEEFDAKQTLAVIESRYSFPIDWMIVDHYALSAQWEDIIREKVKNILVIDDLANRTHSTDILLDCGVTNTFESYQDLNNRDAKILLGPKYALLRPEFNQYRRLQEKKILNGNDTQSSLLNILVNLGGVDKDNLTSDIIDVFLKTSFPYNVGLTIVMGVNAPWKDDVITKASQLSFPCQVLVNVSNMAELMSQSDYAIGAAGSTAWERCCLGLPTVMICMAENQKMIAKDLHELGAAISLDQQQIPTHLAAILIQLDRQKLLKMRKAAFGVTDGTGVQQLLHEIFLKSSIQC